MHMFKLGCHLLSVKGFGEQRSRAFNDWKIACQIVTAIFNFAEQRLPWKTGNNQ